MHTGQLVEIAALLAQTELLILTAAQIELDTALIVLETDDGAPVLYGYKGQAVYYFGRLGHHNVAVAKCKAARHGAMEQP